VVERRVIEEERGDVLEDDPGLGEVGDVLDVGLEVRGPTS
jgi:hypothetical protein